MAMKGLGAAIMTNPIGVFLGALTLVLPYLMDWINGTDDAKTQTEEFGEEASKATAKVQGLMTLLDSVSTSSLTHKEVMEKLKQQYEEYGIELAYMDYEGYPEYPQLYGEYHSNVSILDLLFMTGPDAPKYMKSFVSKV